MAQYSFFQISIELLPLFYFFVIFKFFSQKCFNSYIFNIVKLSLRKTRTLMSWRHLTPGLDNSIKVRGESKALLQVGRVWPLQSTHSPARHPALLTPDKISGTHQWWYFMTNEGWKLWIIIIEEDWCKGEVKWMLHLCDILWWSQTELRMWHGWKHLAELFNVALEKGKWRVSSECHTLLLPLNNSPVLTNW